MNLRALALTCLLCLVLAGCGKPKTVVLLLPDPDGRVGVVTVTNEHSMQVLTEGGSVVRVGSKKSAPHSQKPVEEEERESLFGQALRAMPEPPLRFMLYFISDKAQLIPESMSLLPRIIAEARQRKTRDISVVGYASTLGDPRSNQELSHRRADAVARMLVRSGFPREEMEVTSYGANNPLVQSSNDNEPSNRRVEVTIR